MAEADAQLPQSTAKRALTAKQQGSCHRSDLLDEFAKAEKRLNSMLLVRKLNLPATACITQRLDALEQDASKQQSPYKHPDRVKTLLGEFRKMIALRNSIVHAVLEVDNTRPDQTRWIFNNIGIEKPAHGRLEYSLNSTEFAELISAVCRLSNKLGDQPLREANSKATAKTVEQKPKAKP